MRFFLEIAYKGTIYHGWQVQKNAISVQEVLNKVLAKLLSAEPETVGSGRTDTGVHALQQIIHIDCLEDIQDENFLYRMNKMLPDDISLNSITRVKDDAHARFDAVSRSYEYRIITYKDPFLKDLTYYYSKPLDVELMNEAAAILLKHKDFESFSKVKTDVRTFNCKITRAEWIRKNKSVTFHISADRFLRGMVRTIVGTLLEVGQKKLSMQQFEDVILSKNRTSAGKSAPAHGLYFTHIEYPKTVFQI